MNDTNASLAGLIRSDCLRLNNGFSWACVCRLLLFSETFPVVFWYRVCRYASGAPVRKPLFWISYLMLRRYQCKTGIRLSHHVEVGEGLNLVHAGTAYINSGVKIGKNCTMMHNVTIGVANAKDKRVPIIGDNVFIGPNAVILGAIVIGNNVTIGANCVVTKDFPDWALVVGVPGVNKRAEGPFGPA